MNPDTGEGTACSAEAAWKVWTIAVARLWYCQPIGRGPLRVTVTTPPFGSSCTEAFMARPVLRTGEASGSGPAFAASCPVAGSWAASPSRPASSASASFWYVYSGWPADLSR